MEISPGQNNKSISIIYDEHAEELSFPGIYLGQARTLKTNTKVTPFLMTASEIRQKVIRGVTPHTYIHTPTYGFNVNPGNQSSQSFLTFFL
jgi:hypothetical protein